MTNEELKAAVIKKFDFEDGLSNLSLDEQRKLLNDLLDICIARGEALEQVSSDRASAGVCLDETNAALEKLAGVGE
jgi:hypothetical protein